MPLTDPIAAYNAQSNTEAHLVQQFLESEGIESSVTEDNSLVGQWMFGLLPEIHKPQVWVNRADADRVAELLTKFEQRHRERNANTAAAETAAIEVRCEGCGRTSTFAGNLQGSVQDCPHCGAFVDVGEVDWPEEAFEETDDSDRVEPQATSDEAELL
jgi:hypothetical protein